jgi:hypothetical protein
MRGKIKNLSSLRLRMASRRTSKKKITLNALAGTVDAIAEKVDILAETMAKGFFAVNERFDAVDKRFDAVDSKFEAIDKRFDNLAIAVKNGFDEQGQRLDSLENQMTKVEDSLDNFWMKTNGLSSELSNLKISQEKTSGLVDNVCLVEIRDLKKRITINEINR